MKTKIVYEDNQIIVCHKPPMFPVQTKGIGAMDMESELKNYLRSKSKDKSTPYLGIIHRLDQPVEGIIVFAKNKKAAAFLSSQVSKDEMEKVYEAEIFGHLKEKKGILENYLIKDGKTNMSRVADDKEVKSSADCKKSLLDYCVTEVMENTEKVSIKLHTGRHHQIRVQFSHAGCPLVGDMKYGNADSIDYSSKAGIRNVCLKAVSLSFKHPESHENMTFGL